jgi:hypothetical protein
MTGTHSMAAVDGFFHIADRHDTGTCPGWGRGYGGWGVSPVLVPGKSEFNCVMLYMLAIQLIRGFSFFSTFCPKGTPNNGHLPDLSHGDGGGHPHPTSNRANTDSMVQYGAKVLSITVYLPTVNTLFVIDYSLPFISLLLLVPFLFSLTVRSLITYIFVRFIRPKSVLEKLEQSNEVNQRRRRREKRHGGQITYVWE